MQFERRYADAFIDVVEKGAAGGRGGAEPFRLWRVRASEAPRRRRATSSPWPHRTISSSSISRRPRHSPELPRPILARRRSPPRRDARGQSDPSARRGVSPPRRRVRLSARRSGSHGRERARLRGHWRAKLTTSFTDFTFAPVRPASPRCAADRRNGQLRDISQSALCSPMMLVTAADARARSGRTSSTGDADVLAVLLQLDVVFELGLGFLGPTQRTSVSAQTWSGPRRRRAR